MHLRPLNISACAAPRVVSRTLPIVSTSVLMPCVKRLQQCVCPVLAISTYSISKKFAILCLIIANINFIWYSVYQKLVTEDD